MLELLLPQRCVACGLRGTQLCAGCVEALPRLHPPWCARCGAPTAWPVERCRECAGRRLAFARARAAVVYDGAARALVTAWKEQGLRRLAAVAADVAAEALEPPRAPLVPVPADPDRGLKRPQHPAGALAAELAARWEVPVVHLLSRPRPSRRQRGLALADRRRNVRGAFASRPAPARVVVVDDVYTSGATASAAASALRRAGARHVEIVTFARAVRGYHTR